MQQSGRCGSLGTLGVCGDGGEGEAKVLHKALQSLLKEQGKGAGWQGHASACSTLILRHCFLAKCRLPSPAPAFPSRIQGSG